MHNKSRKYNQNIINIRKNIDDLEQKTNQVEEKIQCITTDFDKKSNCREQQDFEIFKEHYINNTINIDQFDEKILLIARCFDGLTHKYKKKASILINSKLQSATMDKEKSYLITLFLTFINIFVSINKEFFVDNNVQFSIKNPLVISLLVSTVILVFYLYIHNQSCKKINYYKYLQSCLSEQSLSALLENL